MTTCLSFHFSILKVNMYILLFKSNSPNLPTVQIRVKIMIHLCRIKKDFITLIVRLWHNQTIFFFFFFFFFFVPNSDSIQLISLFNRTHISSPLRFFFFIFFFFSKFLKIPIFPLYYMYNICINSIFLF